MQKLKNNEPPPKFIRSYIKRVGGPMISLAAVIGTCCSLASSVEGRL